MRKLIKYFKSFPDKKKIKLIVNTMRQIRMFPIFRQNLFGYFKIFQEAYLRLLNTYL